MTSVEDRNSIAIVGMAGRFPGAENIDELWKLLANGQQATVSLSDADLRKRGIPDELLRDPNYVKSCMGFANAEHFDSEFFGYTPEQALSIDPQQRIFLECAWEALESAGYVSESERITIGVFGSSSVSDHLHVNLQRSQSLHPVNAFQCVVDADKDFLTSRVAYKLGLTGPSIAIQTACSSSLVAVHVACRSLLDYECDFALAGGVSLNFPQEVGYLHIEGGTLSADGRCRTFDSRATGTVPGQGVGIVTLRRLSDAIASGDTIHAIIRSTAVNNDGARKVGFTAPAPHAQARVLASALALADLRPQDIGLVEAHGTGTFLGDTIELDALSQIYRIQGKQRYCALGSIKPNIGHLDVAAGVSGLIKAVLCLKNQAIVPMPNFSEPHPQLAVPDSPFYVSKEFRPWHKAGGQPRRAAVSSFGMGGTNSHVILEEAPERCGVAENISEHVYPISARSQEALEAQCSNLADFLKTNSDAVIGDIAYTLQMGRRRFNCRRAIVASTKAELMAQLIAPGHKAGYGIRSDSTARLIVFMFSGQGAEQQGMISGLYRSSATFQKDVDYCADIFKSFVGFDVRHYLCDSECVDRSPLGPLVLQPSIFTVQYSFARLLISHGVNPCCVIGHSFGEYAAACIAGILPLDSALKLVATRAKLTNQSAPGAMIVVTASESLASTLKGHSLDIAAINSPDQCVISGESAAINNLTQELAEKGVIHHLLPSTRAFHSRMMQEAASGMYNEAKKFKYSAAQIPFVSCVLGARLQKSIDAEYWAHHLVSPVRFADGLSACAQVDGTMFLEIGPGTVLTSLARAQLSGERGFAFSSPLARLGATVNADVLKAVGAMWEQGADINWLRFHEAREPRRISLPSYPFSRQLYSLPRSARQVGVAESNEDVRVYLPEQWFYLPSWRRSMPIRAGAHPGNDGVWLILAEAEGLGWALAKRLRMEGNQVVMVFASDCFSEREPDAFSINPRAPSDYDRLLEALQLRERSIRGIVHCWGLISVDANDSQRSMELGYASVLFLIQAFMRCNSSAELALLCVASGMQDVDGCENLDPAKAALPALCKVISQEYPSFTYTVVDIPAHPRDASPVAAYAQYLDMLLAEMAQVGAEQVLAYRGRLRLTRSFDSINLSGSPTRALRDEGFYLITGGLGRIGFALAERLATLHRARLLLLTRPEHPEASEQIRILEAAGGQVEISGIDLCNMTEIQASVLSAEARFGKLHGVFHLAADLKHPSSLALLSDLKLSDLMTQMSPKVGGFDALVAALGDRSLDFGVAFSSTSALLGGTGFGAYAAANAIMDSKVNALNHSPLCNWFALNWDGWAMDQSEVGPHTVTAEEGLSALWLAIAHCTAPQIVVSTRPMQPRLATRTPKLEQSDVKGRQAKARRDSFIAPKTKLEKTVAGIWKEVLGIEDVGMQDGFLELGGDSLIGLRILSRVKQSFLISIPVAFLINSEATVAAMVREIVVKLASKKAGELSGDASLQTNVA